MSGLRVMIDPGHGGRDPGATVGRHQEAEIVLPYAFSLAAELYTRGCSVRFTRMTHNDLAPTYPNWLGAEGNPSADAGKSIDLWCRACRANEWPADAYVSLHCNASRTAAADGAWVLHDNRSTRGKALALAVFDRLATLPGVTDADAAREVYADDTGWTGGRNIYVLGATRMPAILVELGFLTNPDDLEQILQPLTVLNISRAIAEGVEAWREQCAES